MISFQTLGMYKDSIYNQHALAKYLFVLFHKLDYLWTIKILRNPLMENVEYDLLSFFTSTMIQRVQKLTKRIESIHGIYIWGKCNCV